MLFDSHMKFCHASYAQGLSVYSKDMAFERALKSAQNTHMRNKSIVFWFSLHFACVQICLSPYKYVNKVTAPNTKVDDFQIRTEC